MSEDWLFVRRWVGRDQCTGVRGRDEKDCSIDELLPPNPPIAFMDTSMGFTVRPKATGFTSKNWLWSDDDEDAAAVGCEVFIRNELVGTL